MRRNLANPTRANVVQSVLTFESPEHTLNGLPLVVESLPLRSSLKPCSLSMPASVSLVCLDDRLTAVELLNGAVNLWRVVSRVSNYVVRAEPVVRNFDLTEHIRSPLRVVDVSSRDVCSHRQFRFAVNCKVQLPSEGVLTNALRSPFHCPTSVRIGSLGLRSVGPAFDHGSVDSNALPKARNLFVALPNQSTRNIFQLRKRVTVGCNAVHKPRERRFVRKVRPFKANRLTDERVVLKLPEQFRCGAQVQDVAREDTTPEVFDRPAFRPASSRPLQAFKQFRVRKGVEYRPKTINNRWFRYASRTICVDQGKDASFQWFRESWVLVAPAAPVLI